VTFEIPKRKKFEVRSRYDFRCAYCGNRLSELLLTIDHINPIFSHGKNHDHWNLIPSCVICNNAKGSLSLEQFDLALSQDWSYTWTGKEINSLSTRHEPNNSKVWFLTLEAQECMEGGTPDFDAIRFAEFECRLLANKLGSTITLHHRLPAWRCSKFYTSLKVYIFMLLMKL